MYKCLSFSNVIEFYNECELFLMNNEIKNNYIIGYALSLLSEECQVGDDLFLIVKEKNNIMGVALKLESNARIFISKMNYEAVKVICEYIFDNDLSLPGISGDSDTCDLFSDYLATSKKIKLELEMRQGFYKASSIKVPIIKKSLRAIVATEEDSESVKSHFEHFFRESFDGNEEYVKTYKDTYLKYIKNRTLVILKSSSNEILSIAAIGWRTNRSSNISIVYTPKKYRGNGYGRILTAILSQKEIDAGNFCTLTTDLTNEVSNHIYRKIGYELIVENCLYRTVS